MSADRLVRVVRSVPFVFPGAGGLRGTLYLAPAQAKEIVAAILTAMREPTQEQYDALCATDKVWRELDSKTVWQTYVDALLA